MHPHTHRSARGGFAKTWAGRSWPLTPLTATAFSLQLTFYPMLAPLLLRPCRRHRRCRCVAFSEATQSQMWPPHLERGLLNVVELLV